MAQLIGIYSPVISRFFFSLFEKKTSGTNEESKEVVHRETQQRRESISGWRERDFDLIVVIGSVYSFSFAMFRDSIGITTTATTNKSFSSIREVHNCFTLTTKLAAFFPPVTPAFSHLGIREPHCALNQRYQSGEVTNDSLTGIQIQNNIKKVFPSFLYTIHIRFSDSIDEIDEFP